MLKNNQAPEEESRLQSGLLKFLSSSPRLAKRWPLLLVGLALLAVIILAGGLAGFKPQPGGPFPIWLFNRPGPGEVYQAPVPVQQQYSVANFWGLVVMTVTIGLLIAWIITFILHPEGRRRMLTHLIFYIILLSVILALYTGLKSRQPKDKSGGDDVVLGEKGALVYAEPPSTPDFVNQPPAWLTTAVTLGVIGGVLGLAWFIWQRRTRSLAREDPLARLALHAQLAVDTLQAGSDISDAVLRCYYNMSQALREQRGITRQAAMTAREFEEHLVKLGMGDDHISRLTRLFESVRYGTHITTERDKREAIDCLNVIVRLYGKSA